VVLTPTVGWRLVVIIDWVAHKWEEIKQKNAMKFFKFTVAQIAETFKGCLKKPGDDCLFINRAHNDVGDLSGVSRLF